MVLIIIVVSVGFQSIIMSTVACLKYCQRQRRRIDSSREQLEQVAWQQDPNHLSNELNESDLDDSHVSDNTDKKLDKLPVLSGLGNWKKKTIRRKFTAKRKPIFYFVFKMN